MSRKLVKQTLQLLDDTSTNQYKLDPQEKAARARSTSSILKANARDAKRQKTATTDKKLAEQRAQLLLTTAKKQGIKRQRDKLRKKCTLGQEERKRREHQTTDPIDIILAEEEEKEARLRRNLAYLRKTSTVTGAEVKAQKKMFERIHAEYAARRKAREQMRLALQKAEEEASDEEWAALDV